MTSKTIIIQRSSVLAEVYKITGYTGSKNKNDEISSTSDDDDLLNSYFEEAANSVTELLFGYGYCSVSGGVATYNLSFPSNWNNNMLGPLTNSIIRYIANYICMQWFSISKKEDVTYYNNLCTSLTQSIHKYITERNKPTR